MADAQDLKSWGLKKPCGFESHHRHHPCKFLLAYSQSILYNYCSPTDRELPWPDSEGATMNANNRSTANRMPQPPLPQDTTRKIRTKSVQIRPFFESAIFNTLCINSLQLYDVEVYGFSVSANTPAPRRAAQLTKTDQSRPIFQRPVTPDVRRGLTAVPGLYCTKRDKTGRFSKPKNPDRCAPGTYADAQPDRSILSPDESGMPFRRRSISPDHQNRIKPSKTE
jgi:hypothetical protein